jgi:hypothetical protein
VCVQYYCKRRRRRSESFASSKCLQQKNLVVERRVRERVRERERELHK